MHENSINSAKENKYTVRTINNKRDTKPLQKIMNKI